MTKSPYLLCYDIRDRKRLLRVHRVACGFGISVQYSVFYLELDSAQVDRLLGKLARVIDDSEDDVRLYSVYNIKHAEFLGCSLIPSGVTLL